ncbi:MAG: hypothetical protein WCP45_13535 [Verrucomicrobiota bacterium]
MIKRPLNIRFGAAARTGRKGTTIRDKAWPVGKPIMLYYWTGAAYRSKQLDCVAVVVMDTTPITISRQLDGFMSYCLERKIVPNPLWKGEGFDSQGEMDDWFSALLQPGQKICKYLMSFRLWKEGTE